METESREVSAKEYLMQVRAKKTAIRNLQRDLVHLKEMMYSLGGGGSENERVQTTKNIDKFGTIYSKIDEKEKLIVQKMREYIDFEVQVSEEIGMIQNPSYVEVLHKKYIMNESFDQIADNMGYSKRYVLKVHGQALEEFQKYVLGERSSSPQGVVSSPRGAQMTP